MANKIILKKSSVPSKVPLQQDLDYGELAINYADGLLYFKNSNNEIKSFNSDVAGGTVNWGDIGGTLSNQTDLQTALNSKQNTLVSGSTIKTINGISLLGSGDITISGGSGGNASVSIGTSPPSSPSIGDLWWDSSESNLYIYYQDQDSAQWVPATIGNFVDSGGSSTSGVTSVNGQDGIVTLTSTDIAEGTNLYYTVSRVNSAFDTRLALKTTSDIAEGTNLYFTNTRARAAFSAGTGISINNGVISADNIPDLSSVSQSIVPSANEVYDLGNATNRWRDLYLSGSTINLGGASIKADVDSGAIAFIPQPTVENPNPSGMVVSPTGGITVVSTVGGQVSSGDIADAAASPTAAPVPIDITTTPPTNGQALVWDSANSKFIPDDISGGSGGVTTGKAIAMAIVFGG